MRLYKILITKEPETVTEEHPYTFTDEHGLPYVQMTKEKHLADPELRKEWEDSQLANPELHYRFYLPSERKMFRSRSSARDRVKAVERWGGEAIILEAQVSEFIPVEEANKRRRIKRDLERIKKLEDKIMHIKFTSEIEDLPLMDGDL